ncbi:MAG: hypothetical protein LBG84_11075 [Treponema sp.]|jgi:hypothetical protein|nr:hypothetical protein [Treponema sp.]
MGNTRGRSKKLLKACEGFALLEDQDKVFILDLVAGLFRADKRPPAAVTGPENAAPRKGRRKKE